MVIKVEKLAKLLQISEINYEFLDEITNNCNNILKNPKMYPVVYRSIRRATIQRFPFGIYYQIEEESIVVIAVMHGSRHPKLWQNR